MNLAPLVVIIPCYNEPPSLAERIPELINNDYFKVIKILICNNGSNQDCVKTIAQIKEKYSDLVEVLNYPEPSLAEALKQGLRFYTGDSQMSQTYALLTGADLPFKMTDLDSFKKQMGHNSNKFNIETDFIFIGSKFHPESQVKRDLKRHLTSLFFYFLRRLILQLPQKDTQGTVFSNYATLKKISPSLKATGLLLTTELIYKAHRLGITALELPVTLRPSTRTTKIKVLKHVSTSIKSLLKMRLDKT
jgi:dolichyl-phosphate beta-glucosyltransferase